MFHVINLKRRTDRKKEFESKVAGLGIDIKYHNAIDGAAIADTYKENAINPRVVATFQSHRNVWKDIAEGNEDYGIILEDDVFFNPFFNKNWMKIKHKINLLSKEENIIYIGMGDFLPIHTSPPSEILLKAQEKAHIIPNTLRYGVFGKPRPESMYIFDWYGAFSYIINKKTAQKLYNLTNTPQKPVDVWLKETPITKLVSVPLLTYHSTWDGNIYDSDILGVVKPLSGYPIKTNYITRFVIPLIDRPGAISQFKNTINTILDCAKYPDQIEFSVLYSYNSSDVNEYIQDLRSRDIRVYTTQINSFDHYDQTCDIYNNLCKGNNISTFTAIWEDNKIISKDWDEILFKYYEANGSPSLASFQIKSNLEQNSGKLNDRESFDVWGYKNPIVTTKLINKLNHVAKYPHIWEYLRYVVYIAKINIFVKDIKNTQTEGTYDIKGYDNIVHSFYNNPIVKTNVKDDIQLIVKDSEYRVCGIWVDTPTNWDSTTTIEDSRIKIGTKII